MIHEEWSDSRPGRQQQFQTQEHQQHLTSSADRHSRRRSVPVQLDHLDDPLATGGSNGSSIRDRRRREAGQRTKIEQVFFPPFEEASRFASTAGSASAAGMIVDGEEASWANLLSPEKAISAEPDRSVRPVTASRVLNHRRTQSSTDIATSSRTPLRPSGFSLNKMEPTRVSASIPNRNRSPPSRPRTVVNSISPLTKSARRMLGDSDENGLASPTEECSGGRGLLEAIRLDSLYRSARGEGSVRTSQEEPKPLRRSNTLPLGRNKRKALSVDMSRGLSSNKRFPATVPPRALSHLPEIMVVEPPRPRHRPPPLRNLPPPSWSSPGPSPPLTSLATPFSTDMFVMPYPNPVATMTPGLLSPNYTPPHSPRRLGHCHSVPITPRSDPMEQLYPPDQLPALALPPPPMRDRARRRSSLTSFESTTETIRPWHMVQLTPKPSRAQLTMDDKKRDDGDKTGSRKSRPASTEPVIVGAGSRTDGWRYPTVMDDGLARDAPPGLSLETLVCDWDFDSDDDRDRGRPARSQESISRRRRLRLTAKLRAEAKAARESIERSSGAGGSPGRIRT